MERIVLPCPQTGNEIIWLQDPKFDVAHCYFTANCWVDPDHILLSKMADRKKSMASELWLTDIRTGESRFITDRSFWSSYIVQNGYVYHMTEHGIWKTSLDTGKSELLWSGDLRYTLNGPPSMTDDGRYFSVYWQMEDGKTSINRLDLHTGKMEEFCRIKFDEPFPIANHCMLNPKNGDQMFFSHEGTCQYITNRLWLADYPSHTAHNLFRQRLDEEGNNGEPCGHEMWAADGNGIFFVKYISTTILPGGVWYYDMASQKAHCVGSKYRYWHTSSSPDGHCAAADTQIGGSFSEVVYLNPEKQIEAVAAIAPTDWTHPCHPHPQFSPDGMKLCFTALSQSGKTQVGIVDLTHFIK
ncbi:MAG: hypothetical protein ACOX6P_04765 [Candidatus Merdivicinus sp.]|jgi:Tol biopolymer transport system component